MSQLIMLRCLALCAVLLGACTSASDSDTPTDAFPAFPATPGRHELSFLHDGVARSVIYPGCASATVARMITVEGMGHMWPDRSDGLDGTKLLLDFFEDKIKP